MKKSTRKIIPAIAVPIAIVIVIGITINVNSFIPVVEIVEEPYTGCDERSACTGPVTIAKKQIKLSEKVLISVEGLKEDEKGTTQKWCRYSQPLQCRKSFDRGWQGRGRAHQRSRNLCQDSVVQFQPAQHDSQADRRRAFQQGISGGGQQGTVERQQLPGLYWDQKGRKNR